MAQLRRALRASARDRGERGQTLMIFALLVFPVTFLVGAVAVDASFWQSERRGAQTDADLAALAGALELVPLNQNDTLAATKAEDYITANDESGNAQLIGSVDVTNDCFGTSRFDSVSLNVEHESATFFSRAFGSFDLEIGGHAQACVGSITNPIRPRPIALARSSGASSSCFSSGEPKFGEDCTLDLHPAYVVDLEAQDGVCSNTNGEGDIHDVIEFGADNTRCDVRGAGSACVSPYIDCVVPEHALDEEILGGFQGLLSHEGACDDLYGDGDGTDEFNEIVERLDGGSVPNDPEDEPGEIYVPRPCDDAGTTSPRLITGFVVDTFQAGTSPMAIRYFVTMYVAGCLDSLDPGEPLDRDCDSSDQGIVRFKMIRAFVTDTADVAEPDEGGTTTIGLRE